MESMFATPSNKYLRLYGFGGFLSKTLFQAWQLPIRILNRKQLLLFKNKNNSYNSWFIGATSSSLLYQLLKDGDGRLNP
jgi:hypothetical protein